MNRKGRRIKVSDKSLVLHFYAGLFGGVFALILWLLNIPAIKRFDFREFNIIDGFRVHVSPFFVCSLVIALVAGTGAVLAYFNFAKCRHKQLVHRSLLARMLLENKWYGTEKSQGEGLFKDLPASNKEKISYFPKMYYLFRDNIIYIRVGITMGKYQDQLLKLEKKLETGLFCECIMKELKESFVEYTLLYNMLENRISIDEVEAKDGKLKLMKNVYWKYDSMPHMLCVGGTGGGKTYFLLTLIEILLGTKAVLYILDPKNSDLADLAAVMANVHSNKADMVECLQAFYDDMMGRTESMKKMPNYKTGKNYAYVGLEAHFLVFDEYVAFMEMLDHKERERVLGLLKKIVMLGREVGYFLILACQRPDAKYMGDGIRDQFNFRVALGRNSELGYGMMFGDSDKDFFLKDIKGRGYLDSGVGVITEFYTPEVPADHDFLNEIGRLGAKRQGVERSTEEWENVNDME